MDALEISGVGEDDAKQVIGSPRQQVTLKDLGMLRHRRLEGIEAVAALLVEGHEDEGGARQAGRGLVEQHDGSLHEPRLFEDLDAPQTRRR